MAVCRICGAEFTKTSSSAEGICNNDGCWKKAWNDAVAPFSRGKKRAVTVRINHRTTAYEKARIIQLFKSGRTRRQIYNFENIDVSYETICRIIREYITDRED